MKVTSSRSGAMKAASATVPTILDAAWPMGRDLAVGVVCLFIACPNTKTPGRIAPGV
ncbi:hypothetical protein ACFYT3_32625 [Nocardia amikacinitolerans]|uniref:hypothetical protein n=1 Tax=Nocardia amikacinitolerans TaxID=756689 RepID=UPI0036AE5354